MRREHLPLHTHSQQVGLASGVGAYLLWGVIPMYFQLLNHVAPTLSAWLTLGHRIVWSVVFLALLVILQQRWDDLRRLMRDRRTLALLLGSTLMIAINWLVFIWAVAEHRIMDASLGYFINPLVSIALGLLVLGERLRRLQIVALVIATIGVILLAINKGTLPWVSLTLAISFGLYGLLRKLAVVDPVVGLLVETVFLLPFGIGIILFEQAQGTHPEGMIITALLVALGVTSSVPLLLFVVAARSLRLSTLGFLQYLAPTCQLVIAIASGEPFDQHRAIAFGCIWAALAVYMLDSTRQLRRLRRVDLPDAAPALAGSTAPPLRDL